MILSNKLSRSFFVCLMVVFYNNLSAQESPTLRVSHFNIQNHLAIKGYDPVSYFQGKPHKGNHQFAYTFNGILYHFVNEANLNTFKKNPANYEPVYGGWCAFAMGKNGEKVEINPETYKIIDGKLYLFYNQFFYNTLLDWNKNEAELKQKADENWKKQFK